VVDVPNDELEDLIKRTHQAIVVEGRNAKGLAVSSGGRSRNEKQNTQLERSQGVVVLRSPAMKGAQGEAPQTARVQLRKEQIKIQRNVPV
jgi:hypothetical protein